jgi:hypothetical protein
MDTSSINLEDFTCSICKSLTNFFQIKLFTSFSGREIFQTPVSLSCPHAYCQNCIIGLKKPSTPNSAPISSVRNASFSRSGHIHQPTQCFVCAICRQESLGYVRNRELENQLNTINTSCPNCSMIFTLSELRRHSEQCVPMRNNQEKKSTTLNKHLSESQAKALQKAQEGENRSTFQCPFCPRAK